MIVTGPSVDTQGQGVSSELYMSVPGTEIKSLFHPPDLKDDLANSRVVHWQSGGSIDGPLTIHMDSEKHNIQLNRPLFLSVPEHPSNSGERPLLTAADLVQ